MAYVRYIGKGFWPSHLAIMYLHPGNSLRLWQVALAGLLLLAITVLMIPGQEVSLSASGLVLVPGNVSSNDWPDPGRQAGIG